MPNSMTAFALLGDQESFDEGAEDGYWAGYREGLEQSRRHIMGERQTNPWDDIPEEFQPLGNRYMKRT